VRSPVVNSTSAKKDPTGTSSRCGVTLDAPTVTRRRCGSGCCRSRRVLRLLWCVLLGSELDVAHVALVRDRAVRGELGIFVGVAGSPTRPDTAVAVPAMTAVRAIPRSIRSISAVAVVERSWSPANSRSTKSIGPCTVVSVIICSLPVALAAVDRVRRLSATLERRIATLTRAGRQGRRRHRTPSASHHRCSGRDGGDGRHPR
jgi:hypothetical protein